MHHVFSITFHLLITLLLYRQEEYTVIVLYRTGTLSFVERFGFLCTTFYVRTYMKQSNEKLRDKKEKE